MNAVSLETLLAKADAARDRLDVHVSIQPPNKPVTIEWLEWLDEKHRLWNEWCHTDDIADIGIKHGLEAAMLYKLSDGAIDPRNQVQS